MARDVEMWNEGTISSLWPLDSDKLTAKNIFQIIEVNFQKLASKEKDYSGFTACIENLETGLTYSQIPSNDIILGSCPVSSPKTRCCKLLTLDAIRNCGFQCTYCSIQSFFKDRRILIEANLKQKLKNLTIDPAEIYHIGTGQSSDSLYFENREEILDTLIDFAAANPNVILELKSKSNKLSVLAAKKIPRNLLCT